MELSESQKHQIRACVMQSTEHDLQIAEETNDYDSIVEKYDISLDELSTQPYDRKNKILVVGALSGKKEAYIEVAQSCGIPDKYLDFIDYEEIKHYGWEKLKYSRMYSDIIFGPVPHRVKGDFDTPSSNPIADVLEAKRANSSTNFIISNANQYGRRLRLTPNSFKKVLKQTTYYKKYCNKGEN